MIVGLIHFNSTTQYIIVIAVRMMKVKIWMYEWSLAIADLTLKFLIILAHN